MVPLALWKRAFSGDKEMFGAGSAKERMGNSRFLKNLLMSIVDDKIVAASS